MSGFPHPLSAPGAPAGSPRSPTKSTSSFQGSGPNTQGLNNMPQPENESVPQPHVPRSMTLPVAPAGSVAGSGNAAQMSLRRARAELMAREGYPIPPVRPPGFFEIYQDQQSLQDRSNQNRHRSEEARTTLPGSPSPLTHQTNKRPFEETNDRQIENFLNAVPESIMVPAVDFVILHRKAWFWDHFASAQQRSVALSNSGSYRTPSAQAYQLTKPLTGREASPFHGSSSPAQAGLGRAATSNNWRANAAATGATIHSLGTAGSSNLVGSIVSTASGSIGSVSNAGGIIRSSTMGPMGTFAMNQPMTSRRPLRDVADWRRSREVARNTNANAEADGKENVQPPHVHMVHPPTTIPVALAQPAGQQPPPSERTLIISPISSSIRLADLTYSILAPGGLDWIYYFPASPVLLRPDPISASTIPSATSAQQDGVEQPMVLVTTFANEAGAEQFKSYTDKYGIWVSIQHPQRGPDDYKAEFHGVEYPVFKETHRGILYAKKRILAAEVRFWGKDADGTELQQNGDVYRGMEGMLLQWFKLEDGSGFREAREAGATRVIEVKGDSGTIERTVTAIKCSIEFIKVTSGGGSPVSTFLRFHSLRDAIRATHALKANGYEPMYGRDAADKPVSSSKWRQYYMAAEKALAEKKKKDLRDLVMSDD